MDFICSRCGAHIKHPFQVGGLIFGSECITKIDEAEMQRLFGSCLPLAQAVFKWAGKRMRSKAQGVSKNISIDLNQIPKVGDRVRLGTSRYFGEVRGYTELGVQILWHWQQSYRGTTGFDHATKLEVLKDAA